jgi:hypothetical protein
MAETLKNCLLAMVLQANNKSKESVITIPWNCLPKTNVRGKIKHNE